MPGSADVDARSGYAKISYRSAVLSAAAPRGASCCRPQPNCTVVSIYFATERGREGYARYRREFARLICSSRRSNTFDDATFERALPPRSTTPITSRSRP